MHLEEFADGATVLHKTDPRVKLLCLAFFAIVVSTATSISGPLSGLVLSALLCATAKLHPGKIIRRLIAINAFLVLLWVFLPFGTPGVAVFEVAGFKATREGLLLALSITLKSNAIVLATISLLGTSYISSLAHALVHLYVPEKLVHLFFFLYRYITVLHEEYEKLRDAMALRSFKPSTNIHTYRTYAYLFGMLLVRSHERSRRILKAMLCRGFTGRFPLMRHFSLGPRDAAFGLLFAVATVAIGLLSLQAGVR